MRSPDFCCPRCGGRDWWRDREGWKCRHSAPSSSPEFTDFRLWFDYQFEAETEILSLLAIWQERKQAKSDSGLPALLETTEISRCRARLTEIESNVRLGLLLEGLIDRFGSGKFELGHPPLRFRVP
jgi:hypothetical protein